MGHVLKSEKQNETTETKQVKQEKPSKQLKQNDGNSQKNKPKTVNNNKINTQGCQGSAIIFL